MHTKTLVLLPLLAAVAMAYSTGQKDAQVSRPSAVAIAKATVTTGPVESNYAKQVTVKKTSYTKKPSNYEAEEEDEEENDDEEEEEEEKGYGGEEEEKEHGEEEEEVEEEDDKDGSYAPRLAEVPRTQTKIIVITGAATGLGSSKSAYGSPSEKYFALYNPFKKGCLAVKRGRGLNRTDRYLRTVRCSTNQSFRKKSKMTFHWKTTNNRLANLAWYSSSGREYCARSKWGITKFFPCNPSSTKYSLSETDSKGRFKIRNADKWSSCIRSSVFFTIARTGICGPRLTQEWESIPV